MLCLHDASADDGSSPLPKTYLVALTGVIVAIGTTGTMQALYGRSSCTIEVTTPHSLAVDVDAASKQGCREAIFIHRCPNGRVKTATTLVPTPATLAALHQIAAGTKSTVLLTPIELHTRIHQQIDLLTTDPTAY
jgi:hypothetical protein